MTHCNLSRKRMFKLSCKTASTSYFYLLWTLKLVQYGQCRGFWGHGNMVTFDDALMHQLILSSTCCKLRIVYFQDTRLAYKSREYLYKLDFLLYVDLSICLIPCMRCEHNIIFLWGLQFFFYLPSLLSLPNGLILPLLQFTFANLTELP